ncbi:MAG TPA: AraC family transcriptional regulator [Sphingobacteriaceae bacterium]
MNIVRTLGNRNSIRLETIKTPTDEAVATGAKIQIVFSGHERYRIGLRELDLYPGQFLMLPRGISYNRTILSISPVKSFCLNIDGSFLKDIKNTLRQNEIYLSDRSLWDVTNGGFDLPITIYQLQGDFEHNILNLKRDLESGVLDESSINSHLFQCLCSFFNIYKKEILYKTENLKFLNNGTKVEIMKRLLRAKDYILSNYNTRITLESIAHEACLSVNHLLRTFHQVFNTTPHQFLLQVRLERARYLLTNFDYPVSEVAAIVGFEGVGSFIRAFKMSEEVTPGKFRTNIRDAIRNPK